jgi:uncharacterized membrane protein YgdD (TMEM256/DUF423 family)
MTMSNPGDIKKPDPEKSKPAASSKGKSYPWPIFVALLIPLVVLGVFGVSWSRAEYSLATRDLWIACCSYVPIFALGAVIGSVAQVRRRPLLSLVTLFLAISLIGGSLWIACTGIHFVSGL